MDSESDSEIRLDEDLDFPGEQELSTVVSDSDEPLLLEEERDR